ncbi:hypothetical protein FSP39_007685 [Pinctada imbricata]|uniref:Integrase zinc-binding domain-containing protein n=1 Tax=Pinctada imbricata TaxID=66713 RepID=A0AA88YUZ7_PINIB|nr:hypothetical protein FSP39_007685 [Pinctada imbricata]
MFFQESLSKMENVELHVFSDASELAIAAIAYLRYKDESVINCSFAFGKVKLAPTHGHTIPRLELCAALLATEVARIVKSNLHVQFSDIRFYTDSKVVLGYLNNKVRRFYNYVSNRVDRILRHSESEQWHYVSTKENPADHGTRGIQSAQELEDKWLTGPTFLFSDLKMNEEEYALIDPDVDSEIRVDVNKLAISEDLLAVQEICGRFSKWKSLLSVLGMLRAFIQRWKSSKSNHEGTNDIETVVLRLCQQGTFTNEMKCLESRKPLDKDSIVASLSPFLDDNGLLRVGGRLKYSVLQESVRNPIILSAKSHVTRLLVEYIHDRISHQGRHITEGELRNRGYWIIGAKRLVSSVIHRCVICRKLRVKLESQKMADLPP